MHTPTHTKACTYMNSRLVRRNQGLLGLNTNVMVSRNLYWSTLSALIAWPGLGRGPTRCDWIWKVPIQVVPTGYLASTVQQHQHYTARRKVFKDPICPSISASPPCPQLISCGRRIRSRVGLHWRGRKTWGNMTQNGTVMKKNVDMSRLLFFIVPL